MNQNDIFQLLITGMMVFVLLYICYVQHRRIKDVEGYCNQLIIQWQTWAASKVEDYPTARLMGGIARQNQSAGAKVASVEVPKKPTQGFTIKQSAE